MQKFLHYEACIAGTQISPFFPSLNLHRKNLSKYGRALSGQEVNGLLELLSLSDKTIAVAISSPTSTTSELVPVPSVVTAPTSIITYSTTGVGSSNSFATHE